jgi:hypothetical protein
MDRRLLIGVVVAVLGGVAMGKRKQAQQQWLVIAEFLGGPADGETVEMGCVGEDPCSAFDRAVAADDIPDRVIKYDHYYSILQASLREFENDAGRIALVTYKYDGLEI